MCLRRACVELSVCAENWHGEQRYAFNANVSQKELVEYFLPPFESCIRDAQAGSIMCRSPTLRSHIQSTVS